MLARARISDADSYRDRLLQMLTNERRANVDFLVALGDFDRRRLYLDLGCANLWRFCIDMLRLRPSATYLRTAAVKILHRLPKLADALRDGSLSLSTLVDLGPVLTEQNVDEMVANAAGRTRTEVRALVAPLKRTVPPCEYLRRAPRPSAAEGTNGRKAVFPEEWIFRARLSERVRRKLERAREMMNRGGTDSSWETVLEHLLDRYLVERELQLAPEIDRPRASDQRTTSARRMPSPPADVAREAKQQGGGRCDHRAPTGHLCGSTKNVRCFYIVSPNQGGRLDLTNIRLLCERHASEHRKPVAISVRKPSCSAGRSKRPEASDGSPVALKVRKQE